MRIFIMVPKNKEYTTLAIKINVRVNKSHVGGGQLLDIKSNVFKLEDLYELTKQ